MVRRAFGHCTPSWQGGVLVNNLFYFPSLLVTTAAITAYARARALCTWARTTLHRAGVARGLWLAVGMNVVGLRVGKRLQNLAHGTGCRGSFRGARHLVAHDARQRDAIHCPRLLPASLDLQSINLFPL